MIFIDANIYLDFYRTVSLKRLLGPLLEQKDHILVTKQIVEEVHRNKLYVASKFLNDHLGKMVSIDFPEQLCGEGEEAKKFQAEFEGLKKSAKALKEKAADQADALLEKIARSEDEVSQALAPIFAGAR